jgi:hypothetical protein
MSRRRSRISGRVMTPAVTALCTLLLPTGPGTFAQRQPQRSSEIVREQRQAAGQRRPRSRAGILAVAAPPQWALQLNAALGRAVAEQGVPGVLGPIELRARLLDASGIEAALAEARDQIVRCESASIAMQRSRAIKWAERAFVTLSAIGERYVAPQLTARAHVAYGLAALLHPRDAEAAFQAFASAVDADPTYRPEEDMPPSAATLLAKTRESARRPVPPDGDTLRRLATLSRLGQLIWVGLSPTTEQRVQLQIHLYDSARIAKPQRLHQEVSAARVLGTTARLIAEALRRRAALAAREPRASGALTSSEHGGATAASSGGPRWYERWWVWTIVGAVAVGAGVGAAVALAAGDEPPPGSGFDIRLDLPP